MVTRPTRKTSYGEFEERAIKRDELPEKLRESPAFNEPQRLTWRPSAEIASRLPRDFAIAFFVGRGVDGVRRIMPEDYLSLLSYGWAAGLEMLRRLHSLSKEHVSSYRLHHFLFQRLLAGHDGLSRKIKWSRDIFVHDSGRGDGIGDSLLPEWIGTDGKGHGTPWRIRDLTGVGLVAATNVGIKAPSFEEKVFFGLTAAAELNPLRLRSADKIRQLVLRALLRTNREQVTPAQKEDVFARLSDGFKVHCDDDHSSFEQWFGVSSGNLEKSIAVKAGLPKLERNVVRAAFKQIGAGAYAHERVCQMMFFTVIRSGLSVPLDIRERAVFDAMYLPQPHFGDLPMLLLWERSDLLRNVLVRLWDDPLDKRLIGTLLRLFELYTTIALPRREADCRFKKRPDFGRGTSRQTESGTASAQSKNVSDPRLVDIIAGLIERKKQGCRKCGCAPRRNLTIRRCYQDLVEAELTCSRHRFHRSYKFSAEQLRRAAAAEADEE